MNRKQALKFIQEELNKVGPLQAKVTRLEQKIKALETRVPFHVPAISNWEKGQPTGEWNEHQGYKWRYETRGEVRCKVYMVGEEEIVFPYYFFSLLSRLPSDATKELLFWVDMLRNPD